MLHPTDYRLYGDDNESAIAKDVTIETWLKFSVNDNLITDATTTQRNHHHSIHLKMQCGTQCCSDNTTPQSPLVRELTGNFFTVPNMSYIWNSFTLKLISNT